MELGLLLLERGFRRVDRGLLRMDLVLLHRVCRPLLRDLPVLSSKDWRWVVESGTHLKESLGAFLLRARRIAEAVDRHAEELSRASGGRVSRTTAVEMRQLVEEISEAHAARVPSKRSPIRPRLAEAERLVTTIAKAARLAAETKPAVGAALTRIRAEDGSRRRSRAAVVWGLGTHLALLEAYPDEVGELVGSEVARRARDLCEELKAARAERPREMASERESIEKLNALVGLVRRVVSLAGERWEEFG